MNTPKINYAVKLLRFLDTDERTMLADALEEIKKLLEKSNEKVKKTKT